MKHLAYIASLLLLLCSCSDDFQPEAVGTKVPDGTPIEIAAAAEFPDMNFGADSRAFVDQLTEDYLRTLKVNILVFDEAGVMQQHIPPTDITISTIDAEKHIVNFKVRNIFSSTLPRRLHFVVTSADDITKDFVGGEYITAMANEKTVIPALVSKDNADVYWGLSVEDKIELSTTLKMKVIRNYVKLNVVITDKSSEFEMTGYTVVNRPSRGTVAPYIYDKGVFAAFLKDDNVTLQSYEEITAQGYHGVNPAGADENMSYTEAKEVEAALEEDMKPCYFYERSQSTTATVGGATVTYIIVKGNYNNKPCYYKIDIGHNNSGDFQFYDLLRNFEYTIQIEEVGGPGATSLVDAMKGVAHNNLSASVVTRDLFSINYKGDKIEVSSTRVIFTEQTNDHGLDFRYTVPDGTNFKPEMLKIYDMSSEANAHYNMGEIGTWGQNNLTGEVVKSTSISQTGDWYTLHISTNALPADGRRRQQTLRIYYSDGETNLSRTVELILCQPWELENLKNTTPTAAAKSACDIEFTLPTDLVSTQFPLVLTFESDKQNIYAKNGSDMTVAFGRSGFKGATTDNVILYELSIPYATYADKRDAEKEENKKYTINFLMNTTSADDKTYVTSGIDGQTNGTREVNNNTYKFCIRIANKGMKCIEPYYVNITRQ